jgi:fucose permease
MSVALLFLIALVKYSSLPEIETELGDTVSSEKSGILQFPQAILGAVALFAYVGVEVIAGDTIGLFGANLGVTHFATLTSYTMVFMVLGYLIGVSCIPKYLSQQNALLGSAIAGSLCVLGILVSSKESNIISEALWGWSSIPVIPNPVFFVALMGMAHALVWPSVWPLALKGLGKFTAQGSALLIMGISGGAILPLVFGKIAHVFSDMQFAYWVAFPCYLFILFYAIKGHKMRHWRSQ